MDTFEEEKILFHDDNALSHTSNIAQEKKHGLGFESLLHPPYFPDLTPQRLLSVLKPQEMAVW